MMISDETLTLYYYNDGLDERERREIAAALQRDAMLAARYAELRSHLDRLGEVPDIAAPPHAIQRWHAGIDRAARLESQRSAKPRALHFTSFFWGVALTAALALGIGIGFWFAAPNPVAIFPENSRVSMPAVTARTVPAAFTRGLELHLQESQWEIASLPVDDDLQRAQLALQLIEQNRLYQRSAVLNNSPEVARVLRAFEPVLLKLASTELSAAEAIALREKLAFEMSVMLTKLSQHSSKDAQTI